MNFEVYRAILFTQIQSNTAKNQIAHAFQVLKTKMKTERLSNKEQLKAVAVKTWKSISSIW